MLFLSCLSHLRHLAFRGIRSLMPVNMILLFAMVCGSYAEEIRPFFAFENAFRGDADYATLDEQCKLLVELGYDGIGPSGVDGIPKMIETLDKYNIALSALYVRLTVEEDRATYDRSLETVLERLAGRETVIWLYCPKGKTKPHAPEADATLVAELRHLAELAEKAELKLAIYPHAGFYLATIEETERIVEKVDHPNVGLSWNLCHRLKTAGSEGIEEELERILPKLFCVSINGADPSGKDWSSLIQPLGEGAFDNARLMSHLQEMGYRGPVGLQCYGVPGSAREKLRRSMKAWKRIETKAAESSSAKE